MDPDECIFLDPDDPLISTLRAEVCRIPRKPNSHGKIQLCTKSEMAKPPLSLPSPNLSDALAYAFSVDDDLNYTGWNQPITYTQNGRIYLMSEWKPVKGSEGLYEVSNASAGGSGVLIAQLDSTRRWRRRKGIDSSKDKANEATRDGTTLQPPTE